MASDPSKVRVIPDSTPICWESLPGNPVPTDLALDLPNVNPDLERPEHVGEALGDFGETVVDNDGEVKPEVLDEPEQS